jgi:hypothetical protein
MFLPMFGSMAFCDASRSSAHSPEMSAFASSMVE